MVSLVADHTDNRNRDRTRSLTNHSISGIIYVFSFECRFPGLAHREAAFLFIQHPETSGEPIHNQKVILLVIYNGPEKRNFSVLPQNLPLCNGFHLLTSFKGLYSR